MIFNSEEREAWTEWATNRRLSGEQPSTSMEAFINGLRFWKEKEKVISPLVQALIDRIRDDPERFSIEHCRRDDHATYIRVRDKELGLSKGAWIYIDTRAWYNDCYIGDTKVADNLAKCLNVEEVFAIYKAVSAQKALKRYAENYSILEKTLGRYLD